MSASWPNDQEMTEENIVEYELTEKGVRVDQMRANWPKYELTSYHLIWHGWNQKKMGKQKVLKFDSDFAALLFIYYQLI